MNKLLMFAMLSSLSVYSPFALADEGEERMRRLVEQGNNLVAQGECDKAAQVYSEAIDIKGEAGHLPKSKARRWAQNNLAWLLATCPDESARNGQKAIALAEELVAYQPRDPAYLDTLASSYAEVARFADAVRTEQEVLSIIPKRHRLRNEYESHLAAYVDRRPWRDTAGKPVAVRGDAIWKGPELGFERLDTDRDGRLLAADLIPSFAEIIYPILWRSAEPAIPGPVAREKARDAMQEAANELAKKFAEQTAVKYDVDHNGYISREEALRFEPEPVHLDLKLAFTKNN